ncbi:SH3 domain-containing protein [Mastigocoleus testarum]|uniref:NfeD-like protein n=1 Tax=Mastigocoleus testarum BC008 TaxID=371196 RepID=A0A0V7ZZJ2_9CYAN|nr:NfeD family protein [Mastigocoleus testarum]KST69919.1 NfeD-like protein [Mastigocoleus testarum BC008]KST69964.1 NfeD-like protein [Mastigocoleus testarum BC008]
MNLQILIFVAIAIIIGMCCGAVIVFLIVVQRRRQKVDSLVSTKSLIGLFATVEIPFDRTCRGKVRIKIKGSMLDFTAGTDDPVGFKAGDRVLIVETNENQVWVVGENSLSR